MNEGAQRPRSPNAESLLHCDKSERKLTNGVNGPVTLKVLVSEIYVKSKRLGSRVRKTTKMKLFFRFKADMQRAEMMTVAACQVQSLSAGTHPQLGYLFPIPSSSLSTRLKACDPMSGCPMTEMDLFLLLFGLAYTNSPWLSLCGIAWKNVFGGKEVRSREEGFLGSWHPGTVIYCGKLKRYVRYQNVLAEDGFNYLVEEVSVSKALDGSSGSSNCIKRGLIRPMPPLIDFERQDLKFGLCVDVIHQEAWWEGVIFDQCDGMDKRSVFFPDLGDEMQVEIQQLRITQDWDEVTGKWQQRGNWVFLELFEEFEKESFVTVSAKQIWYDVREKEEFGMIGEWTYNEKLLWRKMVMDVVNDYLTLTIQEVFSFLNLPGSLLSETVELESVERMANVDIGVTLPGREVVQKEQKEQVPPVGDILPFGAGEVVSGAICFGKNIGHKDSTHLRSTSKDWKPVMLSKVELCPEAVRQYTLASDRATKALWMEKLQKHLVYIGWSIENAYRLDIKRYRYISPYKQGKKVYFSLTEVCKMMLKNPSMNSLQSQNDQSIMHPTIDCHLSEVLPTSSEENQDLGIFPPMVLPPPAEVEPEFCPQAVVEYYNSHKSNKSRAYKKKWILKAKNHLLAEGWIFDYPPPTNKKRGIIYMSPQNQKFPTLHAACRFCIDKSVPKWAMSDMQALNVDGINEENADQVWSGELLHRASQLLTKDHGLHAMDGSAANRSTANRKRKVLRNSKANLPKCQSNRLPLRVLRSSKRVHKVSSPCLLHHKPLNVLSWLIDSNLVLPRSKVHYKAKDSFCKVRPMADGRITRDGIRCNCCMMTYSLVGFENHASGRSTCRPSASIILEDGRSLLDCQIQIMQDHKARESNEKPFSNSCQGENDYICSVCHYGGELILCDQCPSSFHKNCLGLEDIPDGDWFCPSCCCGICGQNKIDGDEDRHFLTCVQCEHKYHIRCLKNGAVDISRHPENWVCGKDCRKIYEGLHKLLGKPDSVNNLTWTLVQFINSDSCDLGRTKSDLLAESYSKLNLALSLMHECFEPLKEPFSSRDLLDDVIFSRWSELKRLNFQGFYTVLLERNEELVSVAVVRVYGKKVAEVPLVGTRLQYRRLGMCRILMNELEKKLMQLGVERIVLPAVPSVLETWTGSFGFVKMTSFERSQFLDYTFLDFQGTIMCQKLLQKIPSRDSVLSIESQQKYDILSRSCSVNFDKSSEVYQEEETDKGGMLDQQMGDVCEGINDNHGNNAIDPVTMVEQPSQGNPQCQNETSSSQCSLVNQADRYNGLYKYYYTRRKTGKASEGFRMSS
ncbi:hypothetical protein VNO77_43321 [Canavalia gladiata]|uniref:Uncharacterized protein n=1 Tax=Canavalia gladiata TaxID=3824 RepID=A0AAN9JTV1_CANGL